MNGHDKGARNVPHLRIPAGGSRRTPEPPTIIGPAITPKEQWPLPPGSATASSPQRPLIAPPRPPRPASKDRPSIPIQTDLDAIDEQAPQLDVNRLTVPDGSTFKFPIPNNSRPMTGASIASTSSRYSTGDDDLVPDVPTFPQQLADDLQHDERYSQQLQQQRNRPPLGPPPSARRGPASYYSQHAPVDIIEEESNSDRASARPQSDGRTSFASSNAMGHSVPDYYASSVAGTPVTRLSLASSIQPQQPDMAQPTVSRPAAAAAIARNPPARQYQPPVQQQLPPHRKPVSRPPPPTAQDSTSTKSSGALGRYHSSMYPRSSFGSEKTMSVRFDNGMNDPMPKVGDLRPPPSLAAVPYDISHGDGDPRVNSILGRLTKGGALGYGDDDDYDSDSLTSDFDVPPQQPQHRQQHSDVERPTTRGTNGRTSMTSLPGMIRRATTLASNLDRGRTASRIGTQWFDSEKRPYPGWQPQSMYSDAFPPSAFPVDPMPAQRPGSGQSEPWPWQGSNSKGSFSCFRLKRGRLRHSMMRKVDADPGEKRIWGFTVPMLFFMGILATLFLIAAVLLPIVLLVLPKSSDSHSNSNSSPKALTVDFCQSKLACENGGVSLIGDGGKACQCLCVNGFTGNTCKDKDTNECTGVDTASAKNLTVGTAIPRLFTGAASNYSITLDLKLILGLFSTTNLTCASENALVTFNGLMTRSIEERDVPTKRQDSLVFAPGASTAASGSSSTTPSQGPGANIDTRALDVARIAVMFILQDSNQLNDAIVTQQSLQNFFVSGGQTAADPSAVDIGNGYLVNLKDGHITNPNGTVVGHRTESAS